MSQPISATCFGTVNRVSCKLDDTQPTYPGHVSTATAPTLARAADLFREDDPNHDEALRTRSPAFQSRPAVADFRKECLHCGRISLQGIVFTEIANEAQLRCRRHGVQIGWPGVSDAPADRDIQSRHVSLSPREVEIFERRHCCLCSGPEKRRRSSFPRRS